MSCVNACTLNLALGGTLTAEVWSCRSKQTHASKNDKGAQMQATIIGRMAQRTLSQPEKKLNLTVNSQERSVVAAADTPLLYVILVAWPGDVDYVGLVQDRMIPRY
jgi:hypothetical protein